VSGARPAASLAARSFEARVALVYELTSRNLIASLAASSLLAGLFMSEHGSLLTVAWWLALTIVTAVRWTIGWRFALRRPGLGEARSWARRAVAMAFLAGSLWGLGIIALAPPWGSDAYVLAVFMVAGLPAAALASNSAVFPVYAAFVLPIFLPYSAMLFLGGGGGRVAAGLAALIYAGAFTALGKAASLKIDEAFRLRFENADLAERLARGNVELRAEIALREQTEQVLRHAKEDAEDAVASKSRFLAKMSHEIRTPMNAVLGMMELLLETPLAAEQRHRATAALGAARSLLGIIDDILEFSRGEARGVRLRAADFSVREVVASVVETLTEKAQAKSLRLAWTASESVPQRLSGDGGRLRQVLLNLAGNAVKFTASGAVTIAVDVADAEQPDPCRLRFRVDDTGIGVAPEMVPRLFQPFAQAEESASRRFGGTGLGLAISRQIVEAMAGTIALEKRPGSGSAFVVCVRFDPASEPSPSEASPTLPEPRPASGALRGRVLVVEDNPVNREVALASLESLGCSGEAADDGLAAVSVAGLGSYDAILMDCEMPEMDGYEATRRIRSLEAERATRRTPIIALTASAMAGDRERALDSGMDDYLAKPFTRAQLFDALSRWLAPAAAGEQAG
jgi:signal transduction histidine kinase/ActR/RegA family two-component response regulator